MSKSELFDFACKLKHTTKHANGEPKAYLITTDDKDEYWLAESQCEMELNKDGKTYTATIPMWLAYEKGLV